jgi:hypothetical protein
MDAARRNIRWVEVIGKTGSRSQELERGI